MIHIVSFIVCRIFSPFFTCLNGSPALTKLSDSHRVLFAANYYFRLEYGVRLKKKKGPKLSHDLPGTYIMSSIANHNCNAS